MPAGELVLITGGAGFIGAHTADALISSGHRVRIFDKLVAPIHPDGKVPNWINKEAELVVGDVRDVDALGKALVGVSRVLHLASYQDYLPDYSTFLSVNAAGTAAVYEAARATRTELAKVVVASSQAAYGEGAWACDEHGEFLAQARTDGDLRRGQFDVPCPRCGRVGRYLPCREDRALRPASAYGASKVSQEVTALALGHSLEMPTTCMRYSIVQGRYQSPANPYSGACRIFTLRNLAGRPAMVFEDGKQLRDYVSIRDVVAANVLALFDQRTDFEVYNVGGPEALTTLEYARVVSTVVGGPEPSLPCWYRRGDTRHAVSDSAKLRNLGWTPVGTAGESAQDYAAWAREMQFSDGSEAGLARMRELGIVEEFAETKNTVAPDLHLRHPTSCR